MLSSYGHFPFVQMRLDVFVLFWYYTIQSYLWQNYFLKSLAKERRLTSRWTLQQKCPYFSLHLCLSFIPLAPSNLNPELDMTIVLQLVSVFFSMLNPIIGYGICLLFMIIYSNLFRSLTIAVLNSHNDSNIFLWHFFTLP